LGFPIKADAFFQATDKETGTNIKSLTEIITHILVCAQSSI